MLNRPTRRDFLRTAGATGTLATLAVSLTMAGSDQASDDEARPHQDMVMPQPDLFTAIDDFVEEHITQLRIPGAALGIVHHDRVVHLRGFGRADSSGRLVTPQTPFNTGSLTKSFVALAVMQLVEAGLVELDAPVQGYVPAFRLADEEVSRQITVRHLLNQTSGIPRAAGLEVLRGQAGADELLRSLENVSPSRRPGTAYEYSNANFWPLGRLVERISGEALADYLHTRILVPLGMRQTFVLEEEAREQGLAIGHRIWFGYPVATEMPWHPGSLSSGCLKTSAEDMAHYLIAHLNGGRFGDTSVASPRTMELLHTPSAIGRYAMGWHVGNLNGETVVFHNGGTANYDADMMLIPEKRWGIVLLKNAGVGANRVADPFAVTGMPGIATMLLGKEPPPAPSLSYAARYWLLSAAALILTTLQVFSLISEVRGRKGLATRLQGRRGLATSLALPAGLYLSGACILVFGIPAVVGVPLWGIYYAQPDLAVWLFVGAVLLFVHGALRGWLGVRAFSAAGRSKPGVAAPDGKTVIPASAVREGGKRDAYDCCATPFAFDFLIGVIFAPFGGIRRVRARALDLLDLKPGLRVLELGCGTGGITRLLLKRGVSVTGVDGSERMLSRARRRAPGAQLLCSRLEDFEPVGSFDRVFFAFVLHELCAPDRDAALATARRAVVPGGVVAILDYAMPSSRRSLTRAWRWFLQKLEPSTVVDCLERGYEAELVSQGFRIVSRYSLAAGAVQMILARPSL